MNGRNALQEALMTTIKLTIEYDGSRYPGFSTKKKKHQYRIKAYTGDQGCNRTVHTAFCLP